MLMRMIKLFDWLCGRQRVIVLENQRVLALYKGRFVGVFGPGEHWLPRGPRAVIERHDLGNPEVVSSYGRALMRTRPDLADRHWTVVQAESGEAAAAFREGALYAVSLGPETRVVLWADAGPWEIRRYPLGERLEVPAELRGPLLNGAVRDVAVKATVEHGQVGLLLIDGVFMGRLEEGVHLFWKVGRTVQVKHVDVRQRTYDVTGQEMLTADRLTVRLNVSADVRVVDPVAAAFTVKDYDEALHRVLQLAFRKTVGQRSLDRLLAERATVDDEAAAAVRAAMAEIGVEVGEIALKDVILPGEMREILNRVVEAEKAAEANVIRRREETAATRALLNTAKVMEDNPVMLRLKELEALTELAGKVERLTVHNGTEGLLNDLVKLRG